MGYFNNPAFRSVFLAVLCFVFYGNTLGNDYAFDDSVVITENQFTQKGIAGIPEIFAHNTFRGSYAGTPTVERYRPLSVATFAVEHQFFGQAPHVSHFNNILSLVWLALVLYALLAKVFGGGADKDGRFDWPFVAVVLFIAHPVHTEAVANIKGRDELLAMAGALWATYWVLRHLDTGKRRYALWAFLCFSLALFSKENAITFLAIAPLTVHFYRKEKWTTCARSLWPLAVATVVFLGARTLALGGSVTPPAGDILTEPFAFASSTHRIATSFYTFGKYLGLLAFPHPLTIDYYPFHVQVAGWNNLYVWLSIVVVLLSTAYALWNLKRRSVASFGILFFLGTFSIVSNLPFSVGTFMSERFLFMPSLGFVVIVAWLIGMKLPFAARSKGLVVAAISLACLGKTYARNEVWKNDFTLFTTDVKTSGDSIKGNLAASVSFLEEAGKADKSGSFEVKQQLQASALLHAKQAVALFERHVPPQQLHSPAYANAILLLGDAYSANDRVDAALQTYQKLYAWFSKHGQPTQSRDHLTQSIERTIARSTDMEVQLKNYLEFVRLDPSNFLFNYRVGYLYGKEKNDLVMAIHYLSKAVDLRPNELPALEALSHAYKLSGNFERAAFYLEKAWALKPDDMSYAKKLLDLYRQAGDQAKATELLERIGRMMPDEN